MLSRGLVSASSEAFSKPTGLSRDPVPQAEPPPTPTKNSVSRRCTMFSMPDAKKGFTVGSRGAKDSVRKRPCNSPGLTPRNASHSTWRPQAAPRESCGGARAGNSGSWGSARSSAGFPEPPWGRTPPCALRMSPAVTAQPSEVSKKGTDSSGNGRRGQERPAESSGVWGGGLFFPPGLAPDGPRPASNGEPESGFYAGQTRGTRGLPSESC